MSVLGGWWRTLQTDSRLFSRISRALSISLYISDVIREASESKTSML